MEGKPINEWEGIREYGELVKTIYIYFEGVDDEVRFEVWKVGNSFQCIPNPIPEGYGHLNTRENIDSAIEYAVSSYKFWLIQTKK